MHVRGGEAVGSFFGSEISDSLDADVSSRAKLYNFDFGKFE